MNADELRKQLTDRVYQTAERVIQERAQQLKALLKYEIAVTNTELAMRSKDHGYDFKFLSDSYANNIVLSPVETQSGSVSMKVTIPHHAIKDASEEEVSFFKQFVLANALTKLQRGS